MSEVFEIPSDFDWLIPWLPIESPAEHLDFGSLLSELNDEEGSPASSLEGELIREMPESHVLDGLSVQAIAYCTADPNEFIFATNDSERPLAFVHLTWEKEFCPAFPFTQTYGSLADWNRQMQKEHEGHFAGLLEAAVVDGKALLCRFDAPDRLKRHGELVAEAAGILSREVSGLGVGLNRDFVQSGALLHDVGKVRAPKELEAAGSDHELAGEALLREHGIHPMLARVCRSHARWQDRENTLEELLIALADKLWKGKRVADLELRVVDRVASRLSKERFDVFPPLDTVFEQISAKGHNNLQRSLEPPTF